MGTHANYIYHIDIDDESSLHKIHALICKHIVKEEPTNDLELFYFGWYYHYVENDYILMKKYYLMAIEHGNSYAMSNLGDYYQFVEKDYDKMKQYYEIAIQHSCRDAMFILGRYYHNVKDYDKMKEYYNMAIQHSHQTAIYNLGIYYKRVEKDYDKMKTYFIMSIQRPDSCSFWATKCLSSYYEHEGKNDLSFIDFFDISALRPLLSKRLKVIKKVPKKFHSSFCKWKLNHHDDEELKMKQDILKKTGIYPSNYDPALLLHLQNFYHEVNNH